MRLTMKRTALGVALALGAGVSLDAAALTVTKDLPPLWVPASDTAVPFTGQGLTLGIEDIPTGGRQFRIGIFTNKADGSNAFLATNAPTATGQNVFAGLPIITTSDGGFPADDDSNIIIAGTVDIEFSSCNSMTVSGNLNGNGGFNSGDFSVEYVPAPITGTEASEPTSCVWQRPFGEAGCPAFATPDPDIAGACVVPATANIDITLTNDLHWVIPSATGHIFGDDLGPDGGQGATMTIEPGTVVMGEAIPADSNDIGAFLSISRGNQIMARGTAEAPIVFTSRDHILDPTNVDPGQWGGLVVVGRARTNSCNQPDTVCSPEPTDELQLNNYGGLNDTDSSGEISYARIEYAGTSLSNTAELNGLSLYTVGSGTVLHHIHVHRNGDDGFEWFGGTANAKYLLVTDSDDDSYDWTEGARFKVQYAATRMTEAALKDARGNEGDGLQNAEANEPRALANLANFTIVYEAGVAEGPQQALEWRRGTGVNASNFVVKSASVDLQAAECLAIDGPQTNADAGTPNNLTGFVTLTNTVLDPNCAEDIFKDDEAEFLESDFFNAQPGNVVADTMLTGFIDGSRLGDNNNAMIPSLMSPAAGIGAPPAAQFDAFFDKVNYAGAFVPGAEVDWTAGEWTNTERDDDV